MMERFAFRFDRRFRGVLRLFGVRPRTAEVRLGDERLEIRFGWWHLATPWSNVAGAEVSGPFQAARVIGARLSLADRGVTFGTSTRGGVCVTFREPVGALAGRDRLRHPGVTVTVEEPDDLARAVRARLGV